MKITVGDLFKAFRLATEGSAKNDESLTLARLFLIHLLENCGFEIELSGDVEKEIRPFLPQTQKEILKKTRAQLNFANTAKANSSKTV